MAVEIFTGEAAQQDVAAMPINVLMYSGPGMGKSTDAVELFCHDGVCTAFVIQCEHNAIKAPAARGFPVPEHSGTVMSWQDMETVIGFVAKNRSRYTGVILDGFSVFSSFLYKQAQESLKGWDIPMFVRGKLLLLREWIRQLGLHSIYIAHPIAPGVSEGVFYQGGFALTPKTLISEYFTQTDTVLRVDYVTPVLPPLSPPNTPLPPPVRAYFTGGEVWNNNFYQPPDWRFWRTKNREGCNDAVVPANLGLFLRGRKPPYRGL